MSTAVITNKGLNLLKKLSLSGQQLNISRVGFGIGIAHDEGHIKDLEDLINYQIEGTIISISLQSDAFSISMIIDGPHLYRGTIITEAGVFAVDSNGEEILYAYLDFKENPQYIHDQFTEGCGVLEIILQVMMSSGEVELKLNFDKDQTTGTWNQDLQQLITNKEKGAAEGAAALDGNGKILRSQLPIHLETEDHDIPVYGVEVDFETMTITRLADAAGKQGGSDFDQIGPWKRRRCIMDDDGNVLAYYGEAGYTESGFLEKDVITNGMVYRRGYPVQVMVEQPIFWSKVVPVEVDPAASGKGKQLKRVRYYISPEPREGYQVNEIFRNRQGILQNYIYLSAFEGVCYNPSPESYYDDPDTDLNFKGKMLSSVAGYRPITGRKCRFTREIARCMAVERGSGWELYHVFALAVTQLLALVEYASFDMQEKVGYGATGHGHKDSDENHLRVRTGTTEVLGNRSGSGIADPEADLEGVSYRGEENLWGNCFTLLDGININVGNKLIPYLKPSAKVAEETITEYRNAGLYLPETAGFLKTFLYSEEFDYLFFPAMTVGDEKESAVGDFYQPQSYITNGICITAAGGAVGSYNDSGLWNIKLINPQMSNLDYGARIIYISQHEL